MLRTAEAGRGGILLIEGEPGIGKSRFLEESATAAAARGFTLSWGQAVAQRMPGNRVLVPTLCRSNIGFLLDLGLLGFQAARSYSLIRPLRMGFRRI
jgi:hypothetical protein